MMPVLTVLGGSTPFTAALVEALRDAGSAIPRSELRLFGQDASALEGMNRYATRRLAANGWTVSATPRLAESVDGADVVVNQIRFGGLAGRARDEALANRFQLPADETLGPCGLSAALRVVPRIRDLAAELGRRCAGAWVVNLANPLSVTTAAMIDAGAPRKCVGVCELPLATVAETCRLLRVSLADVEWDYAGLNHRGFIFALKHHGEDLLPGLPDLLEGRSVFGITGEDIRGVGALPLKYFRLAPLSSPAPAGRAAFLEALKQTLAREMELPEAPPPALRQRDLGWYPGAVVPMIEAIFADERRQLIVNVRREDGLVREGPVRVARDGWETVANELPPALRPWLDRWAAHERAVLDAVASPGLAGIERALELDPVVPNHQVREMARAIWAEHEQ
jgi:6-phospho-beta-glucosidase